MNERKSRDNFFKTLISVFLIIGCMMTLGSCNLGSVDSSTSDDEVVIGIAWRADLDSEFYTNITCALDAIDAKYVMLDQVTTTELEYDGKEIDSSYVSKNDYIKKDAANIIKNIDYDTTNVDEVVDDIDGIIFTGGEDVSPALYAKPKQWHKIQEEKDYNATRDVSDYILMTYCLKEDIPVMGFCRGMQMLGIVSGAKVLQDIPKYFKEHGLEYDYSHRNNKETADSYRDYAPHDVKVTDKDSALYEIAGGKIVKNIPSWHHQVLISAKGTPLKVTGITITNGIRMIEAIQRKDKTLAIGFQFHPEAAVYKHKNNIDNKDNFLSLEQAKAFFSYFANQIATVQ